VRVCDCTKVDAGVMVLWYLTGSERSGPWRCPGQPLSCERLRCRCHSLQHTHGYKKKQHNHCMPRGMNIATRIRTTISISISTNELMWADVWSVRGDSGAMGTVGHCTRQIQLEQRVVATEQLLEGPAALHTKRVAWTHHTHRARAYSNCAPRTVSPTGISEALKMGECRRVHEGYGRSQMRGFSHRLVCIVPTCRGHGSRSTTCKMQHTTRREAQHKTCQQHGRDALVR
jgi:hypothetical protein